MSINPDAKKWVIITAVSLLAVVFMCYAAFTGGRGAGRDETKKEYTQQMSRLQKSYDSLSGNLHLQKALYDSLGRRHTQLVSLDSTIWAQVAEYRSTVNSIQKKYESLRRYDTLGPADIGRYLQDSLP